MASAASLARARAAREGWEDPLAYVIRCKALRESWVGRRLRARTMQPPHMYNIFTCLCGAECVGTLSGPRLCSMCRAERCS